MQHEDSHPRFLKVDTLCTVMFTPLCKQPHGPSPEHFIPKNSNSVDSSPGFKMQVLHFIPVAFYPLSSPRSSPPDKSVVKDFILSGTFYLICRCIRGRPVIPLWGKGRQEEEVGLPFGGGGAGIWVEQRRSGPGCCSCLSRHSRCSKLKQWRRCSCHRQTGMQFRKGSCLLVFPNSSSTSLHLLDIFLGHSV